MPRMLMMTWSSSTISSTVLMVRGDPRMDSMVSSFSYE